MDPVLTSAILNDLMFIDFLVPGYFPSGKTCSGYIPCCKTPLYFPFCETSDNFPNGETFGYLLFCKTYHLVFGKISPYFSNCNKC